MSFELMDDVLPPSHAETYAHTQTYTGQMDMVKCTQTGAEPMLPIYRNTTALSLSLSLLPFAIGAHDSILIGCDDGPLVPCARAPWLPSSANSV